MRIPKEVLDLPRDNAFQQILNNAVEKAQNDNPKYMKIFRGDGNAYLEETNKFFQKLSDSFVQNNALEESDRSMIRSAAFALRVVNSIDATKKIQKNIEEFFDDEKNNDWFAQQGITTDDEKKQLKEDLTKHVEEQLEVKAHTDAGKKFVQEMKDCYEDYAESKNPNSSFLQDGCAFLRVVTEMATAFGNNRDSVERAYARWETFSDKNNYDFVPNIMYNALAKESEELSQEIQNTPECVHEYLMYFGGSVKIKPLEFVDRAKKGKLTLEDKIWAEEQYQNVLYEATQDREFGNVGLKDFMLNGKPMFSEEEIAKTNMDELSCKVVESMIMGHDVSIKNPAKDQTVRLEPLIVEQPVEKRNFIQRFFDHIKELFNSGKVEQMHKEIAKNTESSKVARDRMTFDQLTGKNAADKLVMPPSKDKQLSAEHKLEKGGMSAGQ